MKRVLSAVAAAVVGLGTSAMAADTVVYVGTYTGKESKGVYCLKFDPAAGTLGKPELAGEVTNPSFLAVSPDNRFLYAVGEIDNFAGKKAGAVSAFAIDAATNKLSLLNQQPSGGRGPCWVALDRAGRNALVANYGSGSVACLPIGADGKLAAPTAEIQHAGPVADPKRQGGPHAHSINLDPANKFAFAADLGLDKVFVYKFDAAAGTLVANDPPAAVVAPWSGPRHFAWHPSGKYAYVINELANTVIAFSYDADKGTLTELQAVPTLPAGYAEKSSTAEVAVHPSGKFVYGSNRGHDSIARFAVDAATGKLTPTGHTKTQGKSPRHFAIDPTGQFLLAANQGSDSIVTFRIDQSTGDLTPVGTPAHVASPVCLKFLTR